MLDALAAILKALLYTGLLSCAGAVFAQATLRVSGGGEIIASQIMRRGALIIIAACVASALVLIFRLGGEFDNATLSAVFSSGAGAALFMQLTGAGLLLASGEDESARGTRVASAAIITLSVAFSGHAATMGPFQGLIAFAHASAAAWWVGSLWLLRVACAHAELSAAATLVNRFSTLATRFIGALVITGLLLIAAMVGFEGLPSLSAYEQNLARKLVVVVVVFGLASYNKFRLTPRLLAGDATAAKSLRRMIDAELVFIAVVLIATAVLTTYTSPHE